MLYREIISVCSQIHTKHINTLCEQNVELLNVVDVNLRLEKVRKGNVAVCNMVFCSGKTRKHSRPATVGRTPAILVFPVTIKARMLIEAYRRDCRLIASLLSCGDGTVQYLLQKGKS